MLIRFLSFATTCSELFLLLQFSHYRCINILTYCIRRPSPPWCDNAIQSVLRPSVSDNEPTVGHTEQAGSSVSTRLLGPFLVVFPSPLIYIWDELSSAQVHSVFSTSVVSGFRLRTTFRRTDKQTKWQTNNIQNDGEPGSFIDTWWGEVWRKDCFITSFLHLFLLRLCFEHSSSSPPPPHHH
jgi:hypothetical protein